MGATEIYVLVLEEELARLTNHDLGNWQLPEYREITRVLFQDGEDTNNE